MSDPWLVSVYVDNEQAMAKECDGPLELGRQDHRLGETLYDLLPITEGGVRVPIAPADDTKVSRRHARLEALDNYRARVQNFSQKVMIGLEEGRVLKPGEQLDLEFPITLRFGAKVVRIERAMAEDMAPAIRTLDEPISDVLPNLSARISGKGGGLSSHGFSSHGLSNYGQLDANGVIGWLRAMIQVLQSAASDADFFEKAAKAVVDIIRLDMGRVLVREGNHWTTAVFYPERDAEYEENHPPSRMVVNRVCEQKKTCWRDLSEQGDEAVSLVGVSSVVAAPVLSRSGEVIAILYGERRLRSLLASNPVNRLDAMLVEVLAVGLSGGLARVEQERAALALQAQFEQFFTPELARLLATRPEMLEGQDLEITVLFCDIRGFSRITRNHGPAFTLQWTNDVLSTLSECVLKHQGVLVDYIGDELMAMWGAPEARADHAELACRAALDIIASLDELNDRWQDRLGLPMGLGIGINTGLARVGNTGSRRKFKYGPLGDTVNIASRVQGASKYFKSSLLITRATREKLGPSFQLRRLGSARVVGMNDPIELFELCPSNQPEWVEVCSTYEEALVAFEARDFRLASRILGRMVNAHTDDGPSLGLLARATAYVFDEPDTFDPAFRLPGK